MKIEWSPLAIERIVEISEYIARDSPIAAEKWVLAIFEKVTILSTLPHSGRMIPELQQPAFRELILGNYRIVYRVGSDTVSILTIRHTRQILPVEEIAP